MYPSDAFQNRTRSDCTLKYRKMMISGHFSTTGMTAFFCLHFFGTGLLYFKILTLGGIGISRFKIYFLDNIGFCLWRLW
jgi:hypothetical protein